ncbi:hypothetical protein KSS87_005302 [Heliosperma pusillum]|nr:hypothetical protein KSS87_005302 [Heliosperma pusillum]
MEEEEPVTPIGRLCLLPEHNHVIHCAIEFKNPIDIDALKHEISNSIMIKIPRFSCILTVDPRDGSEHWKKVNVTLDDHIVINCRGATDSELSESDPPLDGKDEPINSYLADIAISSPMKMDKPLWELHILHAHNCIIMRVHHSIADGMSLMSLLWTMGRSPRHVNYNNNDENNQIIINNINYANNNNNKNMKNMGLWKSLDVASMLTKNTRTPWGNRFSVILLPFIYMKKSLEPLAYVTLAKEMMDRKKLSMEARLSYNVVSLTSSLLGPKALTMHMVGYQGWGNLQIQVAKDVITDPNKLAMCFENALLEMKEAAQHYCGHVTTKPKPN